ncbi:NAD(P)/FAD-dependent oxidoreductase [Ferrimonas pelagia]|uniref:NAD(P)/FAD-dependent oxidoreductase n=1 Tax=Ferrimonas pelagia TaxID=1177826 RepID=A0ABP9FNC2_9GAMM
MTKIVVVGGGAGGMELLKKLSKLGRKGEAEITLVDVSDHHIWKPLLHELATGSLDEGLNAVDYRVHGSHNYYRFEQGAMAGLDRINRRVLLAPLYNEQGNEILPERALEYDYLVIGIGAVTNDFGVTGVKEHAYSLDLTSQAMKLRERIQQLFLQHAHGVADKDRFDMAIVGAGATGVEMAAEMHHMSETLRSYGYDLSDDLLNITLVEASDSVMPALDKGGLRQAVNDKLLEIGVDVRTETRVTEVTEQGLHTAEGEVIQADLVLWAAGVKAPEVLTTLGLENHRGNQLVIEANGRTTSDPRIFAFGDCAPTPQADGQWTPPRGQVARQMALLVGDNLIRLIKDDNAALKEYVYKDLGSFVNLSRFHTVGNMFSFLRGGLAVAGCPARFVYASLYRRHMLALHGPVKGTMLLALNGLQRIVRPQLKLW